MTYAIHEIESQVPSSKKNSFRSSKNLDQDAFREDLRTEMRRLELDSNCVAKEYYKRWHDGMTAVLNKHMPIKKMRVRERDAPYITIEWKEAIRKKRTYAKRHKQQQTRE